MKVAIFGAGTMGSGIAQVFAAKGHTALILQKKIKYYNFVTKANITFLDLFVKFSDFQTLISLIQSHNSWYLIGF